MPYENTTKLKTHITKNNTKTQKQYKSVKTKLALKAVKINKNELTNTQKRFNKALRNLTQLKTTKQHNTFTNLKDYSKTFKNAFSKTRKTIKIPN